MALLEVKDLHTSFFTDAGEVKAVNGVSFNLDRGKVLGIVGESGSGKSVTVYSVMQILAPAGKIVKAGSGPLLCARPCSCGGIVPPCASKSRMASMAPWLIPPPSSICPTCGGTWPPCP